MVGFLGAVFAAFSLGYTSVHRGHIAVDFLVQKLPARVQSLVDRIFFRKEYDYGKFIDDTKITIGDADFSYPVSSGKEYGLFAGGIWTMYGTNGCYAR